MVRIVQVTGRSRIHSTTVRTIDSPKCIDLREAETSSV
jgi:hypothetical protein